MGGGGEGLVDGLFKGIREVRALTFSTPRNLQHVSKEHSWDVSLP